MQNHVKLSHKFYKCSFILYGSTVLFFPIIAFQTYICESIEERILPLLATFPFGIKNSPNYEILYLMQTVLLLIVAQIYIVSDSTYVTMVKICNIICINLEVNKLK